MFCSLSTSLLEEPCWSMTLVFSRVELSEPLLELLEPLLLELLLLICRLLYLLLLSLCRLLRW